MPVALDIKKVDSVSVNVRDLERSARFYSEVLGLPEIWRVDEQKARGFGVGDNSATINLQERADGGMEIVIQVDRVDEARRELERNGVRFEGDTSTISGIGRAAVLRDPDGNRLMLLDYTIEHGDSS